MPRKGTWLGFAVAGAGTYYLYSISENQNKASHHFADDPARIASMKEQQNPSSFQQEGAQLDQAVAAIRDKASESGQKTRNLAKEEADRLNVGRQNTSRELNKKIEELDKTTEQKLGEVKSNAGSWFDLRSWFPGWFGGSDNKSEEKK